MHINHFWKCESIIFGLVDTSDKPNISGLILANKSSIEEDKNLYRVTDSDDCISENK